ncbi:class I fructose-bisphosphate aldolase [Mucilaginibacter gotjawali]|uniref:Fructose-bisphosphate aldolase class I n=2 Tax=Mucilaginibacter gotjawali TaxID=1550579 RepID=A0A839SJ31_9SPHI|nr:class I fructose-bisphosphate aldolase [Mucilaginibacter gotjawali]MBB3057313.1 fructose-bisphosphate aldolase class I [Mucilaginibacter gotjawali]BAU52921.1 Fructose-bisphosphate aldolase class 1 [Mucilaginibacter gotjawali]
MKTKELSNTIKSLLAGDKGLLAMDESTGTCNKRFEEAGIPQTIEYHRAYREMIVTAPGLGKCISGAILFDETIHQATKEGVLFIDILKKAGIVPGIKVDEGTTDLAGFPGEKITLGLDGLKERLARYYQLGLRFAKWRAVISISSVLPGRGCIEANMHALARYAALCQEAGIVPIVEPEVLMDGPHDLKKCFDVTSRVQHVLFDQLYGQNVNLKYLILKPNMVLPGLSNPKPASIDKVAEATVNCLLQSVPAMVPGIAFLSGGQSAELATAHLNAMHVNFKGKLPWALTFSFARAIQQPAMELWKGKDENVAVAQKMLYHRASLDNAARRGEYTPEMERVFV